MRNGSIKNTSGRSLTVGPFFCKIEQAGTEISSGNRRLDCQELDDAKDRTREVEGSIRIRIYAACLEEAVAEELPGPAEELRGEDELPGEGEAEAGREGAAGGPCGDEEQPRERAGSAVDSEVGGGVGEREGQRGGHGQRQRQRQEVEDEEVGEEDGPGEQRVRRRVHGVPVLRPEEGELRLQVQHPAPVRRLGPHGRTDAPRPGGSKKSWGSRSSAAVVNAWALRCDRVRGWPLRQGRKYAV